MFCLRSSSNFGRREKGEMGSKHLDGSVDSKIRKKSPDTHWYYFSDSTRLCTPVTAFLTANNSTLITSSASSILLAKSSRAVKCPSLKREVFTDLYNNLKVHRFC